MGRMIPDPFPSHAPHVQMGTNSEGQTPILKKRLWDHAWTSWSLCYLIWEPDMLHSFTLMDADVCMEARRPLAMKKWYFSKTPFCFLLWPLLIPICILKLHWNSDRSLLTMPSSSLSGRIINEAKSRWLMQKGSQIGSMCLSPSRPPLLCCPGYQISCWAFLKAYYSQDVIRTIWLNSY